MAAGHGRDHFSDTKELTATDSRSCSNFGSTLVGSRRRLGGPDGTRARLLRQRHRGLVIQRTDHVLGAASGHPRSTAYMGPVLRRDRAVARVDRKGQRRTHLVAGAVGAFMGRTDLPHPAIRAPYLGGDPLPRAGRMTATLTRADLIDFLSCCMRGPTDPLEGRPGLAIVEVLVLS
jgi:hypothetical protein